MPNWVCALTEGKENIFPCQSRHYLCSRFHCGRSNSLSRFYAALQCPDALATDAQDLDPVARRDWRERRNIANGEEDTRISACILPLADNADTCSRLVFCRNTVSLSRLRSRSFVIYLPAFLSCLRRFVETGPLQNCFRGQSFPVFLNLNLFFYYAFPPSNEICVDVFFFW